MLKDHTWSNPAGCESAIITEITLLSGVHGYIEDACLLVNPSNTSISNEEHPHTA